MRDTTADVQTVHWVHTGGWITVENNGTWPLSLEWICTRVHTLALLIFVPCLPMLTSGSPELVGFRSHHSFGAMVLTTTKSVPYSHFVSAANMHFVPDLAQSAFNLLAMIAMLAASKKYNFTQRGKIIFSQCLVKGRWVKKSPLPGWPQLLIVSEEW